MLARFALEAAGCDFFDVARAASFNGKARALSDAGRIFPLTVGVGDDAA